MSENDRALRRYVAAKLEVAATLQAGRQLAAAEGRSEAEKQYQELQVRLAEDRFNLAVVGQFKRGKSSLMNAVIGRNLLPTGLLPLTSAITTLRYGPQERVLLRRRGWVLEQEIQLAELADYVTERNNPGNEKGVIEARVELPVPFLRRGLYFVDTPGVGSAQAANTETTYAFLPQTDAVIFVTSVEAPLSEVEEGFLRDIRKYVRRLFIVVNKMDLLADSERDEVLAYLRTGLARLLGAAPRLYPVSARQALAARLEGDEGGVAASGLTALESDLAAFLARERGQTFLVSILDRALPMLDGARPASGPAPAPDGAAASRVDLRRQMTVLRDGLLTGEVEPAEAAEESLPAVGQDFGEQVAASQTRAAAKPSAAMQFGSTCPVCAAQTQALLDFFVETQYLLGSDPAAQHAFAREHGFCPVHTWQFQPLTSPQGLSAGLAPLISALQGEVRRLAETPPDEQAAHSDALLPASDRCAACRVSREAERAALASILEQLTVPTQQRQYEHSAGLCLRHLRAALAARPPAATAAYLLQQQAQRLEEIGEDLRNYLLKRAALRRGLTNTEEEAAWRRALVQLVGERHAHP